MAGNQVMDSIDLKVNEFLKDVKLDYSAALLKSVDETIASIKLTIDQIPEEVMITAKEAPGFITDIGADAGKVQFKFKKPDWIGIGGSYSIHCVAKPELGVDLLLRLPKECFYEKDYLDHRYHGKRFLYLSVIKKYLMSCPSVIKVEWSTLQNEARKPILIIYPVEKISAARGMYLRIIPTARNLFNCSHLRMDHNNIRSLRKDTRSEATPVYNSSILEDMFIEDCAEMIQKTFSGWDELVDALILLKVWLRQRDTLFQHDCLNGFLLAILLSYLTSREKINKLMKPMQIFRLAISFIAKSQLWSQGLFLQKKREIKSSEEEKLYKELFPVIIRNSYFNLGFRMSRSGFNELQEEAAKTIRCLEECGDRAFEDTFMTKLDIAAKFDHCIRLNLRGVPGVSTSGFCLDDECWRLYERRVEHLLQQGLSDRASFIRVLWKNVSSPCCIDQGFSLLDESPLHIGILVSSEEKVSRVVDIGPPAEKIDEAIKFRKFWGEKAELRRFKDGNIAETVVWESDPWTRHLILKQMIEFLLSFHLALSKCNILHVVDQLDFSLLHGISDPMSIATSLHDAFEILSKRLRDIDIIPLNISTVQALDPALRFTSVFPPGPHPFANGKRKLSNKVVTACIQPMNVMIQFESSGYWPSDNIAIEKTKLSFLLKIAESLQRKWGMNYHASEKCVRVFLSGYCFHLQVMLDKGFNLIKSKSGKPNMEQLCSADWIMFCRSQHASMINGLQSRFPIYGPVVRLAKRWIGSHLFSACLVEEAIELLVAYLFVKPLPFNAPCSRITGFLRFLRLLSEHDWTYSALIVDINNDINSNDSQEIHDNFMNGRKDSIDNFKRIHPAMFLATAYDKASKAWTSTSPTSTEIKRMVVYARSSANLLTKLIEQDQNSPWESIFKTPLSNYDAVVLLHAQKLAYPQRLLFPSTSVQGKLVVQGNASHAFQPFLLLDDMHKGFVSEEKLMVDFDPIRSFISDLKEEFSDLKVWYDSLGGDAMGLTWKKSSKKRENEESDNLQDPVKLLKSVGAIGKGLVKSVYLLDPQRTL